VTDVGYVAFGYAATGAALALYALRLLRRGRRLSQQVPPEELPWRR
jgi:hypothetical protein